MFNAVSCFRPASKSTEIVGPATSRADSRPFMTSNRFVSLESTLGANDFQFVLKTAAETRGASCSARALRGGAAQWALFTCSRRAREPHPDDAAPVVVRILNGIVWMDVKVDGACYMPPGPGSFRRLPSSRASQQSLRVPLVETYVGCQHN